MNEQDDWKPPIDIDCKDISILVIDDDHTSLSVIAGILRTWKYNVETVRSGGEALSILRSKQDKKFDLVVTDIHMPDMNGFELLKSIWIDFQVPIVMMSSDDSEKNMTKGLECGASYFMRKPVCPKDLQNLWLYVIPKRNQESVTRQNVVVSETSTNTTHKNNGNSTAQKVPGSSFPSAKIMSKEPYQSRVTLVEKHTRRRKISTLNQKLKATDIVSVPPLNYPASVFANRKPKVAWFTGLHNKFLDALKIIGLDRAVPKKILEVMNVPGLTRENVASHLQKYRIFLKRVADVAEKGDKISKPTKSKFASSYLPMSFGFDLENLDGADENLLRKKLKQELRAIRDPLYITPSWRQYGTIPQKNNVASNYNVQMSVAGVVELGGTSGDITHAGNCQMINGQQPPAFVPYEMNMNCTNTDVSGFQSDFSECMIQELTGGDRIMNSSVCFPEHNFGQTELQTRNQESETFTRETSCARMQQDCSYFGEDFNPWFDQEHVQTQAGNQNANMLITDELLAMCQGFRGDAGNSSRIGSPTK